MSDEDMISVYINPYADGAMLVNWTSTDTGVIATRMAVVTMDTFWGNDYHLLPAWMRAPDSPEWAITERFSDVLRRGVDVLLDGKRLRRILQDDDSEIIADRMITSIGLIMELGGDDDLQHRIDQALHRQRYTWVKPDHPSSHPNDKDIVRPVYAVRGSERMLILFETIAATSPRVVSLVIDRETGAVNSVQDFDLLNEGPL